MGAALFCEDSVCNMIDAAPTWISVSQLNLITGATAVNKQRCQVHHQLAVGTVDELVALFRKQLEEAMDAGYNSGPIIRQIMHESQAAISTVLPGVPLPLKP
jgi:hypothetical protein